MVVLKCKDKSKLKLLERYGLRKVATRNEYEEVRYSGNGTVILYKTGKVVVQGRGSQVAQLEAMLIKSGAINACQFVDVDQTIIGTDEALKGDTFGGLVVAGVRANKKQRQLLLKLGVRDSKLLHAKQVSGLFKAILKSVPWAKVELAPEEYNASVAEQGITEVLNKLHMECYEQLKQDGEVHVVDKFPGCRVGNVVIPHAESEFVEVAAASIIARYFAIKQIKQLSKEAGFELPMGSTHVGSALRTLKEKGMELRRFAKIGFRNVGVTKDL
ncbi:hypothetical protein DRJ48_00880 [Candidatus Woesearchaeota archaeon]|nr:hypothetical protein [Candidatus Woesearchaeota archaeon]RLE43425.1 MAG: hypothetical protein DRJ48_00880 [Candidatus Woesearchaeota archaeon]